MAFGGKGIARFDGLVYFVRDTVPGDEVLVRIDKKKKRYAEARVVQFLKKSSLRRESKCSYAKECGGCVWDEISYEDQIEWKKQFVESALQRIGKIEDECEISFEPSPMQHGYRNRIRLRGYIDRSGSMRLGYYKRDSRDMTQINRCAIAADGINLYLEEILNKKFSSKISDKFQIEIQELYPSSEEDVKVLVTVLYERGNNRENLRPLCDSINEMPRVSWCGFPYEAKKAPFFLYDEQNDVKFYTKPAQFQQVNRDGNRRLRTQIYDFVKEIGAKKILDLYCGSGNLSYFLQGEDSFIRGVENNPHSILAAKYGVGKNPLKGTYDYICDDVETYLKKIVANKDRENFDLIISDPPREGMGQAIGLLATLNPNYIVLVGCDPNHLARDFGAMVEKGYKPMKIELYDFFPNTFHVETVVFLVRD